MSLLEELTAQAKASPRLRMNLDLRNSPDDQSQRMLNAIEPGVQGPIHRHIHTSETIVILRGHLQEFFYNENGSVVQKIDLTPHGPVFALSVPIGQWHSAQALESGTVILMCKDGPWEPIGEEDVL